jgi:hypothetical protein
MKQVVTFAIVFAVASSIYASFTQIGNPQYFGRINIPKAYSAIDANFAKIAQVDTNATTTTTLYTPDFEGQVLSGGAGTGTNAIWIATGTTTNDWLQIKP